MHVEAGAPVDYPFQSPNPSSPFARRRSVTLLLPFLRRREEPLVLKNLAFVLV